MIVGKHHSEVSKSANPILKKFFTESNVGTLLCKKKAGSTTYIGGEGIILYEDLTPLIMFTLDNDGRTKYKPIRQILRINPIIYSKDDLLAKHIRSCMIGKLFPLKMDWSEEEIGYTWMLRNRTLKNANGIFTNVRVNWDFKILIEDFSEFFRVPSVPDCTFSSTKANEFLYSKYDDIMKDMQL